MPEARPPLSDAVLFRKTLVVAAAVGLAVLLWKLTDIILLVVASVLVAFILFKLANILTQKCRLPFAIALALALLLPTAFVLVTFALFGNMLIGQFTILFDQLPQAFADAQTYLRSTEIGRQIEAQASGFMPTGSSIVSALQTIVGSLSTVATSLVVVLVGGIYLAAQPKLYGQGVLGLIPPKARPKTLKTTAAVADAMTSWLKAQGLGMIFVGIFTGVALSIIGIPAAPAIGVVAGICEFVPYLGTIVVAIPAILIGFSISPETGMWTIAAIVIVQQIQGNIVTPLVQSSMAELPPALTIFALIAAGIIFGPMGVILAVPLTVLVITLVRELLVYEDEPAPEAAKETTATKP